MARRQVPPPPLVSHQFVGHSPPFHSVLPSQPSYLHCLHHPTSCNHWFIVIGVQSSFGVMAQEMEIFNNKMEWSFFLVFCTYTYVCLCVYVHTHVNGDVNSLVPECGLPVQMTNIPASYSPLGGNSRMLYLELSTLTILECLRGGGGA